MYVAVVFVKRVIWTAVCLSPYRCSKSCLVPICLNIPYPLLIMLRHTGELRLSSFWTVFFNATWINSLRLPGERPNPSSTPPLSKRIWFSQQHLCRYIAGVPRRSVEQLTIIRHLLPGAGVAHRCVNVRSSSWQQLAIFNSIQFNSIYFKTYNIKKQAMQIISHMVRMTAVVDLVHPCPSGSVLFMCSVN